MLHSNQLNHFCSHFVLFREDIILFEFSLEPFLVEITAMLMTMSTFECVIRFFYSLLLSFSIPTVNVQYYVGNITF